MKSQYLVRIVVTNTFQLRDRISVSGYIINLSPDTLYAVILEVEVTSWHPIGDPPPPPPTKYYQFSTQLTATMLGQINLFGYGVVDDTVTNIGPVRFVKASTINPSGEVYYPLAVLTWDHNTDGLFGTLQNDSSQYLHKARIFVYNPEKCSIDWMEAELTLTELQPGEKTNFTADYPEECLGEDLVIIGQGAAAE